MPYIPTEIKAIENQVWKGTQTKQPEKEKGIGSGWWAGDAERRAPPEQGEELPSVEVVTKSLVIFQFIHLLMALATPDDSFFKSYEQKIFRFIWYAKPDKIKFAHL